MKNLYRVFVLLIFLWNGAAFSYYYENDFTTSLTPEFQTNWRYSKNGLYNTNFLATLTSDSDFSLGGAKLNITGTPGNVTGTTYNGIWMGNTMKFTNKFNASAKSPLGFRIRRTYSRYKFRDNNPQEKFQNEMDLWLVDATVDPVLHWDFYQNVFCFAENIKKDGNARSVSNYVQVYDGQDRIFGLSNVLSPYQQTANMESFTVSPIFNYNVVMNNSGTGWCDENTNVYDYMMTHNGDIIKVYLNADPLGRIAGVPNEYYEVYSMQVNWNQNIQILIGHMSLNHDQKCLLSFTNFLIRSVFEGGSGYLEHQPESDFYRFHHQLAVARDNSGFNVLEYEFPSQPQLVSPPRIAIDGIMITPSESTAQSASKAGSTGSVFYIHNNVLYVVLERFFSSQDKDMHQFQISTGLSLANTWREDDLVKPRAAGRQFDNRPVTWGKGATCGSQQVEGDYFLNNIVPAGSDNL